MNNTPRALTPFRLWVQNLWMDNKDEHSQFRELPFTQQEYWDRYKYWLKREYRHQQGNQ